MHLGARAASMGGAYTGVADDATAFYWNPAAISVGRIFQVAGYYGRDEMERGALSDDGSVYADGAGGVAFAYTFMGVALTSYRHTFSERDDELLVSRGLETFDVAVSILQSLPVDNLVVAGNVHYYRGTTYGLAEDLGSLAPGDLEPAEISSRVRSGEGVGSSSYDFDFGVLYEPNDVLRFGLMWRNLREARFRGAREDDEVRLSRHARAGVSYRLPRAFLVAFDADLSSVGRNGDTWRELSFGIEKGFFDGRLFTRAGVRSEVGSERGSRPAWSIGAGGKILRVRVEGAYLGSSGGRDEAFWVGVSFP